MKKSVLSVLGMLLAVLLLFGVTSVPRAEAKQAEAVLTETEQFSASSSIGGHNVVLRAACKHTYASVTTKQPTCTAPGNYEVRCTKCNAGSPYGGGQIPPLGHNYSWVTTKQATCTANGTRAYRCTRCNAVSKTEKIPAPGHKWNISAPTCTTAKKCTVCGTVGQAALGHNYVTTTITPPTCGTGGKYEVKCSLCNLSNPSNGGGDIPATGKHTWNISAATCTTAKKCTVCGTVGQKALGHSYSWVTTKQATCTANGKREYRCTRCNTVSKTETITAPGHKWNVSAPTCTTAMKCTVCGTVNKAELGHAYSWVTTKQATCTANGTRVYRCSRCNNVSKTETITSPGHSYTWVVTKAASCTATGTRAYRCSRCNYVSKTETIAKTAHTWNPNDPACKQAKKCANCGQANPGAKDHDYQSYTTQYETCGTPGKYVYKCSMCGVSNPSHGGGDIPPNGRHTWDKPDAPCTETRTCTVCKTTQKGEHTLKTETVKVDSCTTDTVEKCTKCSYSRKKSTAVNHNIITTQVDVDTCTKDTVEKCTKCSYSKKISTVTTHSFDSNDTCSKCYIRRSNLDLLIVSGTNGGDDDFTVRRNKIAGFNTSAGLRVRSLDYTGFRAKKEFLECLDVTACFHYMGHGTVTGGETALAPDDGEYIYCSTLANRDLSNLAVASVIACNTAGVYAWEVNNGTYTLKPDSRNVGEEKSIAYSLCKNGAKMSFGCCVEIPFSVANGWDLAFGEYYPYLMKYANTIKNASQKERYMYDMTTALAEAIVYSYGHTRISGWGKISEYVTGSPNYDEEYKATFIMFTRNGDGSVSYRKVCGPQSKFTEYTVPILSSIENLSQESIEGKVGIVEYFKNELPKYAK